MTTPTQAQLDAGFSAAQERINDMVKQLVPAWALGMVQITDDEVRAVSDAVVNAAFSAGGQTPEAGA